MNPIDLFLSAGFIVLTGLMGVWVLRTRRVYLNYKAGHLLRLKIIEACTRMLGQNGVTEPVRNMAMSIIIQSPSPLRWYQTPGVQPSFADTYKADLARVVGPQFLEPLFGALGCLSVLSVLSEPRLGSRMRALMNKGSDLSPQQLLGRMHLPMMPWQGLEHDPLIEHED